MTGLLPVAALRFREAMAGRILWLLPLHFVLAFAAARGMPGPTPQVQREAADATALALAAALGLVAAAMLGAAPLPDERGRARGTLVLTGIPGPAARVLGTALGTGAALALLVGALLASALAAVETGLGAIPPLPRAFAHASFLEGGVADPRDPALRWITADAPIATAGFHSPTAGETDLFVDCRTRVDPKGEVPGMKRATIRFVRPEIRYSGPPDVLRNMAVPTPIRVRTGPQSPFRVRIPAGTDQVQVEMEKGNFELGLTLRGVRFDAGPRSRALARGLHGVALFAGLFTVMAAALAISTVTGTGVGAAGALTLALLSLFRDLFVETAATLAHAGAVEKAMALEIGTGADIHDASSATPPALAPLFRALATMMPDGSAFDLSNSIVANAVPGKGDAVHAVLMGAVLSSILLGVAVLGARRRP